MIKKYKKYYKNGQLETEGFYKNKKTHGKWISYYESGQIVSINKYRDGNLEPNKSLSFLLKIIPFTELGVPNVGSLVGK